MEQPVSPNPADPPLHTSGAVERTTSVTKDPSVEENSHSRGIAPETFWFRVVLAFAVAAVVLALVGRQGWRQLKIQRGRKLARTASTLIQEQKYPEAQRAIRAAVLMAPSDPEVLRSTARWSALAGRPESLKYWAKYASLVPLTPAEQLEYLDLALALNRLDVSKVLLRQVLARDPKGHEITLRVLRHNVLSGDLDSALKSARTAAEFFPADEQIQLTLGGLLIAQKNRLLQAEGRRVLWNLALGTGPGRDGALEALMSSQVLDRGDKELLIHTLEKREPPTLNDQLKALNLRMGAESSPRDREALLQQSLTLATRFPGPTNRLYLAAWLLQVGATNRAIELVPWTEAGTNSGVAVGVLDLLLRSSGPEELPYQLARLSNSLPAGLLEGANAVIAARAGRSGEASGHLAVALKAVANRPAQLLQVATLAEKAGQPATAVDALLRAAEIFPSLTLPSCRRALALVRPLDDLTVARRAMNRLADFLPGEDSVVLERVWLDLLFNDRIDGAVSFLLPILEHPQLGEQARFALALAELRQGKNASALGRIEAAPVDPERLPPRLQAVYVAVLQANDQREQAQRLVRRIPLNSLRGQERELIARLL